MIQFQATGPVPILGAQRFQVFSKSVNADFIIDISVPLQPAKSPWPVHIVTDGNLCFASAAKMVSALAMEPAGPEPAVVVGIGYAVSGAGEKAEHHTTRVRDLSPWPDAKYEAMMRRAPAPFTWDDRLQAGGADRFLDFILTELLPWLEQRFNIDPDRKTLTGISMGGLFCLYALFARPGAFENHIAISPAIWWANCALLDLEAEYAARNTDLTAGLSLAVGALEEAQDPTAKMVSHLETFTARLRTRNYPSLNLCQYILADETHMSVFTPAFSRALRHLGKPQNRNEDWAKLDENDP